MVQKAIVLKTGKEKAVVRIISTGIEKEVTITKPVEKNQEIEVFHDIIV